MIQRVDGLISENQTNKEIFDYIIKTVSENRSIKLVYIRGKGKVIVVSLFDSAIGLLLAERHLEEDSEFYKFAHQLLLVIHAINHQIATWGSSTKATDEYFLKNRSLFESLFAEYDKRLKDVRKKLLSSC